MSEAFTGFPKAGLTFLRDLKDNNEREWFNARKATYVDDVSAPLAALVAGLADAMRAARLPLAPNPRKTTFRIYRDVRFSNDKTPYKPWVSFLFHRNGDPAAPGVLYVHVDPKEPFLAAGFYHPEKPVLDALRAGMLRDPKRFAKLVESLASDGVTLMDDEKLVRVPPAFKDAAGTPVEEFVKFKSVIGRRSLAPKTLASAGLIDEIVAFATCAKPLLEWGWKALA